MEAIVAKEETISNFYTQSMHPVLIVISGPSGVGKDTVVKSILDSDPSIHFVVTATSRPPRPAEIEGVDYFFYSQEKFEKMIANGEFLEYAVVHDNYKGVPKTQIRQALNSGKDVIMRVDPQGAATLKKLIPEATFIFLTADSLEVLAERLRKRKTESGDVFDLRLKIAQKELARIKEFDYLVTNREGQVNRTVEQILAIVQAEKCRVNREPITL